jgi:putative hydrolase of the HAD superfamily
MTKQEHKLTTIAFDADDTLWVNETIFSEAQERCKSIASKFIAPDELHSRLYAIELRNLEYFGYGIKGFMLSMIETLIEISNSKVSATDIHRIIDLGKEMIQHPVHLLDGVEETLEILSKEYELMIITKGDLFDQESKIARSGLADIFDKIEIVSDKTPTQYQKVLAKYGIDINHMCMVGNSVKSDILPICNLGGLAIHIPFHTTWVHEKVEPHETEGHRYYELADITLVPDLVKNLDAS